MKRLTLLKNRSDEAFNASSLSTLYKPMQNLPLNRAKQICEGKDNDVFQLCYGNYGNNELFWKLLMEFIALSLLRVNISPLKR
jgi:hypothetical protein